jgi:DNA-binding MarR family transcriptional regulator
MVELVNRLAERGFVQRCRDEEDLRRVLVSITAKGEEILRELSFEHRAELRTSGPALAKALNALLTSYNGEASSTVMGGITAEAGDET